MFTRLFCLVHPLIDDDYDPNDPMKLSSSGRTTLPPQPLPVVPRFREPPPATLFEVRVIMHGRVALIKAEAADLERQLTSIPDNDPAHRLLRKRMDACKKIVADVESALHVIDAAARHQSKPLPFDLDSVDRLINAAEHDLCVFVKGLERALLYGNDVVFAEGDLDELANAEVIVDDEPTDQH
jgi:hypothetical protein